MCGIIGIQGEDPTPELLFQGMLQLQHRGQDAAGVFLFDPASGETALHKKSGWVFQLFEEGLFSREARWGLGHIRYSTSGRGGIEDAQPLVAKRGNESLAIVHNGNLVNYTLLREKLESEGVEFQTQCDTETILHLLSRYLSLEERLPFFERLCSAVQMIYEQVFGAYSIIGISTNEGIFAFRDPKGMRPLLLGVGSRLTAFASETLALSNIGCREIQDVVPGEVVLLDRGGTLHRKTLMQQKHRHCAFEFNYFAKTHSVIEGREVYTVRTELGRLLAEKIRSLDLPPIDVVVPIPETGNPAGIALAHHLQVPFAEGFIRHQHAGRTFIISSSERRQTASFQKLAPIRSVFDGKTVLLVDDSIVRGVVSKRTVALARNSGAKIILFSSTFPPVVHPCVYGIDFPCSEQLIATTKSDDQIAKEIGADFVIYNDAESLKKGIGFDDLCLACVTGKYPTATEGIETLQRLREQHLQMGLK